jgi:hypothetical protein
MKQSEPANPRNLRTEGNAISFHGSAIAAEISGYADIGMKAEALRLVRRTLERRRILPEEFGEAVRTIGIFSSSKNLKKWKPRLEAAYNRQSRRFKREVRPLMVEMYGSMREWESALQFLSVRKPSSAGELFFGMETLLELNKLEEAKTLAALCRKALSFVTDRSEQSLLLEALASFFARTRDWDRAISAWQHASLEQPFRRDALSGIVKIHLSRAFEAAERGLEYVAELKKNPNNDHELVLPGNDLALTAQAENELLKFKRGIEKILSEKVRKELGVITETN